MASPYEVAIHLTVTGNAQAGLAGLSTQMNKLNEGAEKLHKAFALIFVGGEAKRWGEEALGGVKKVLDLAGNFQQVQSQMAAMGMTQKEIAESVGTSWKNATANIHVGVQEMAEMNRHAIEIFGGAEAAAEHMSLMAKLAEFQAKWGAGKTGLKQVDVPMAIRDMMKTTEGAAMLQKDPKVFDDFAEKLMRAVISAGGNVSATQILQAQRLARGAQFGWTDEYRFGAFPALVQEYGHAAGTSSYQGFKRLGAGVGWDKTGIVQGIQMGLIDPSKVEYDKVGRPMRLMPGALTYAKEFGEDPLKFTEQHITPWLDKNVGKDPAARTAAIVRLLGRATGTTDIQAYDMQSYKLHKDIGQFQRARMEMPDTYVQAMKAFEEKWKDFMIAVGTPSLRAAADALGAVTKAIMALTGAALAHPDAARSLLGIAAGFGVFMTALGTLAIGAGIASLLGGGVVIVGLTALTGALAGLAAANWPVVSTGIQWLIDKLNALHGAIVAIEVTAFEKVVGWMRSFGDALTELWNKIKSLNPFSHTSYEGGGVGGGGGSYGGAHITNAAWSGGGGGVGAASRSYSGAFGTGSGSDVKAVIDRAAASYGVNPRTMYGIIAGESAHGNRYDSNTRGESSWSMFQLNRAGGLGNVFERDTGLSVRDPANIPAIADWTAKHIARTHNLSPWRGYHGNRDWNPNWGSMGYSPRHKGGGGETHVHNHIHLDGKIIARSTSKHLANHAQYATSVGRQDGRGTFMGPGAEAFA